MKKKKAIVFGGSSGIGKAIVNSLDKSKNFDIVNPSSSTLNTSNIKQIKEFIAKEKVTDILVLNTGGPPAKDFFSISEDEWLQYYYQLFYGFVYLLQNIKVNDGGYIFLITSHTIKNPENKIILSNTYRVALTSVLKTLSKIYAERNISCINIAPGPIKTKRLLNLVDDMEKFEESLPMKRAGNPDEIGRFVKAIIENEIKYLTGVTINFDGGLSNYLF
jgi:3-oxoacyl-[acyl-carrier protein] reductase